jgi:hypothetical protein
MARHVLFAVALTCFLVGVLNFFSTKMLLSVGMVGIGIVLAFIWVLWTAKERIEGNARSIQLSDEDVEKLKRAVREKKAKAAAAQKPEGQ